MLTAFLNLPVEEEASIKRQNTTVHTLPQREQTRQNGLKNTTAMQIELETCQLHKQLPNAKFSNVTEKNNHVSSNKDIWWSRLLAIK